MYGVKNETQEDGPPPIQQASQRRSRRQLQNHESETNRRRKTCMQYKFCCEQIATTDHLYRCVYIDRQAGGRQAVRGEEEREG